MKIRTCVLVIGILFITNSLLAQKEIRTSSTSDTITLEGILNKKQWSKSIQSFCAQGYEYYTLTTDKEEIIVDATDEIYKSLDEHLNRKVLIIGFIEQKIIPQNDMLQHPVGSETICTIFHFLQFK